MGGFLSVQSKEKRRRTNRLSKPPPNRATLASNSFRASCQTSGTSSPTECPACTAWQDPWTGTSISLKAPEPDVCTRRSQSLPSASYRPGEPWPTLSRARKCQSMVKEPDDFSLYSHVPTVPTSDSIMGGQVSRRSSRHNSFQATTLPSRPQPLMARPPRPRRAYSAHTPPQRAQSTMHHSTIEEATSSNTLFRVDSQGFSIIRRRSLLTRPGIATRRPARDTARRLSSPVVREPTPSLNYLNETSASPRLLPSGYEDDACGLPSPVTRFRPATPNEFEYTHLGALKLGSLRVVNGSASPCPSDRTRLNRPNSPDPEPSSINTHDTKSEQPQHSSHKVPCYMDQKAQLASESADEQSHNAEIVRDSGHEVDLTSFDLSNIQDYASESAIEQSRKAEIVRDSALDKVDLTSFDLSNIQDYAPVPCNDTARAPKLQIPPSGVGNPDDHPASPFSFERSPATSTPYRLQGSETEDEGVSIADEGKWFVHQLERSFREHGHRELQHAQGTVDSGYSSAASVRSTRRSTDSRTSTHQPGVARRSTFNGNSKDHGFLDAGNSPELGFEPSVHRHSSLQGPWARPKVDSYGWPSHRWSMCHDFRPMPPKPRLRSSSFATPPEYRHTMPYSQYCHQLRSLDTASPGLSVVSAGAIPHQSPQWEHVGASLAPSEKSWKQPMTTVTEHDVQGSSSTMSAAWLPMPNIDALRMAVPESMEGLDTGRLVSGQLRGRARSRSIESQRKRLTRHAKHPDLYKAASPTIFR
ncbi:hypothetical protein AnigIFM59636_007973 [Aspergillus niger]|uniref:Uncharacterized protein n=3 Tax=Aspergillus niger TaxID=5061 RepID=A2RBG5_ASPNC|nr:uncharacterized protein BO96DRAFT_338172 [Aspergillus niger CBS 101883]XP_059603005.1 hypothetical protein An18g06640 [Aspergillus niger]RDH23400.1 hypothetical protein M747DRAFT_302554 [Aspergillus niger ATCC 13496]PYH56436.1 hypothetical protein BO96DRAFT_338172 [Aspergillus niger CBS 101883]CAK43371.1 hypothetical protein An18g06640 [Aspergillus niger]GJP98059.1 uncharacterized protein AlacWU_10958 [Aspergillus niger]GKZ94598.1 hypothetical protein AnigIFM59636_007973 [Aspergillus niger